MKFGTEIQGALSFKGFGDPLTFHSFSYWRHHEVDIRDCE